MTGKQKLLENTKQPNTLTLKKRHVVGFPRQTEPQRCKKSHHHYQTNESYLQSNNYQGIAQHKNFSGNVHQVPYDMFTKNFGGIVNITPML